MVGSRAAAKSSPIRLALVGAGAFAQDAHMPSLQALGETFEIVAICSRSGTSAHSLAQRCVAPAAVEVYTDFSLLLVRADIEALDLLVPIGDMPEMILQGLSAGKHILSEKPIAPDVAAGRQMVAHYGSSRRQHPGQVWMVGENWRYEAAFLTAAGLVESGAIGQPLLFHWSIHMPIAPDSKYHRTLWRRTNTFPGGFLLDTGVHHVAALRLVLGEIKEVAAAVTSVRQDLPPADTLSATLRFQSGAIGAYLATYAAPAPWSPTLHITGTKGALRLHRDEIEVTGAGGSQVQAVPGKNGVQKELAAFAAAIRLGRPHANSPHAALQDLAVMEAILQAARSGQWVTPEQISGDPAE